MGSANPYRRVTTIPLTEERRCRPLLGLVNDARLVEPGHGPHALPWTHADVLTGALLDFIAGQ